MVQKSIPPAPAEDGGEEVAEEAAGEVAGEAVEVGFSYEHESSLFSLLAEEQLYT